MLISLAVLAAILIFVKSAREPTLASIYRGVPVSVAIGVAAGAAMHFALSPLFDAIALQITGTSSDLSSLAAVHGNLVNYLVLLAIGLLFGGVLEELVGRGFLIGWGSAVFGARWAIVLMIVSAVGFGLAHLWQGAGGMITTGLSGLFYGFVYLLCGRKLLPAVMTHATSNFLGITAIYLYGVA